jgi:HPt (histidine-containing phosphotransfer) domain-containing protein
MVPLDNHPILNPATISMLRTNTINDPGFLTDLFQSFIEDTEELMVELNTTAEENQVREYFDAVHTLKGLSGTIGCSRMFELLKVMDTLNKQNDFERSKQYLSQLDDVFDETKEVIEKEILS